MWGKPTIQKMPDVEFDKDNPLNNLLWTNTAHPLSRTGLEYILAF